MDQTVQNELEMAGYAWACGRIDNATFRRVLKDRGYNIDFRQADRDNRIEITDQAGNFHYLTV